MYHKCTASIPAKVDEVNFILGYFSASPPTLQLKKRQKYRRRQVSSIATL